MSRRRLPYLQRRCNGSLSFRISVPVDLRRLTGCREITKSLATTDSGEGIAIAMALAGQAKQLFQKLRSEFMAKKRRNGGTNRTYYAWEIEIDELGAPKKIRVTDATPGEEAAIDYDANGRLTSITDRSGLTQTLTYSGTQLQSVSDAFGRTLNLTYDARGRVETLTDPAGRAYAYAYDAAGNLVSVTYPTETGTVPRVYHYNEAAHINGGSTCSNLPNGLPHALTGITDEKGVRYATYEYDCQGRAVAREHAGSADKITLTFNVDGTTTVTDFKDSASSPNTTRTYGFTTILGVFKQSSVDQPCTSGCGSGSAASTIYDGNGNPAIKTDFNGYRTDFQYDSTRNLELTRTEGLSSTDSINPESRRTTTTWHSSFRLPATVTASKRNAGNTAWVDVKQTSYTYDTAGRLLTRTETALDVTPNVSRTWTYTWNTSGPLTGLLATVNGPRTDVTDVTTYSYYTDTTGTHRVGDLWKVTNALNHVTTITDYDANGRPLSITDPNGLVTTLTYHPRGWLASQAVNDGVTTTTTSYTYDNAGQLARITLPDLTYID